MFRVFINDGTQEMPNDDILYIVGKDGLYLKKKLGIMESLTKIDGGVATLQPVEQMAKVHLPKIPADKTATTVTFFRRVYATHKSESMVLILYDPKTKLFILLPPTQEVSSAAIDYDRQLTVDGYLKVGTIHSHANFSAFHSGVDIADEKHFDGLHITIGNVADEEVSITASIVANEKRFKVDPLDYMEGITQTREKSKVTTYPSAGAQVYVWKDGALVPKVNKQEKPKTEWKWDCRFKLTVPEDQIQFNENWLGFVTKKTYKYSYGYGYGYGGHYGGMYPASGADPIIDPDGLFDWYESKWGRRFDEVHPQKAPVKALDTTKGKDPKAEDATGEFVCSDCSCRDEAFEWTLEVCTEPVDDDPAGSVEEDDAFYRIHYTCSTCFYRKSALEFGMMLMSLDATEEDVQEDLDERGGQDLYEYDPSAEEEGEVQVRHPDDYTDPLALIHENLNSGDFLTDKSGVDSHELEVPQVIIDKTTQGNTLRTRLQSGLNRFLKKL
jgi:hypothetical protein